MPSPEKQAASGAIDRVGVGFVAANDAIVGRLLAEAEVLDGAEPPPSAPY
jgi:hypothetical protein